MYTSLNNKGNNKILKEKENNNYEEKSNCNIIVKYIIT